METGLKQLVSIKQISTKNGNGTLTYYKLTFHSKPKCWVEGNKYKFNTEYYNFENRTSKR